MGVDSSVSIVTMLWVNSQQEHCAQPALWPTHIHKKSRSARTPANALIASSLTDRAPGCRWRPWTDKDDAVSPAVPSPSRLAASTC